MGVFSPRAKPGYPACFYIKVKSLNFKVLTLEYTAVKKFYFSDFDNDRHIIFCVRIFYIYSNVNFLNISKL